MTFEPGLLDSLFWIAILWGLLVGFVFSLVGAAGGILASFGLITLLGVTDANQVKPMAQALTLVTPLIAVPGYFRQCRVVASLALVLAAGGMLGAVVGSTLSARYLGDLATFKSVFALLVLVIALQLLWSLRRGSSGAASRAAQAFEGLVATRGEPCRFGVRHTRWSVARIEFDFGGEQFFFRPWMAFAAGFGIAVLSSALGVGGGFLLVPFMAMVIGLPMFIVAGTAALAIFVSSSVSIANYLALGVRLDWGLLTALLIGTVAGAWLGPLISRFLRERWLRLVLSVVLSGIGLRYLLS